MDAMQMMIQGKETMNALIDTLYDLAYSNGLSLERETLVKEFEAMAMYVAGTDNDISSDEISFMNFMFDLNMSASDVPGLISLLSDSYNSLVNNLELTGWMLSKAADEATGNRQVTDVYIDTMKIVMQLFSAIDGETDPKEEQFIEDFANRLRMDR